MDRPPRKRIPGTALGAGAAIAVAPISATLTVATPAQVH
jgi:hypothetical protein